MDTSCARRLRVLLRSCPASVRRIRSAADQSGQPGPAPSSHRTRLPLRTLRVPEFRRSCRQRVSGHRLPGFLDGSSEVHANAPPDGQFKRRLAKSSDRYSQHNKDSLMRSSPVSAGLRSGFDPGTDGRQSKRNKNRNRGATISCFSAAGDGDLTPTFFHQLFCNPQSNSGSQLALCCEEGLKNFVQMFSF